MSGRFEQGADVDVLRRDGTVAYTGEFVRDNDDGTALVDGPIRANGASGYRREDLAYLKPAGTEDEGE